MKFSFKLKALCAAIAVTAASAATASPIYLDVGTNYAPGADKVNATSTSVKNEIVYTYQSTTVITDLDANGIDAGDLVSTSIGLFGGNLLANNRATGFNPGENFGLNADNGYAANWMISFKGENLMGQVSSVLGGVPLLSYAPGGIINMLLTFNGTTFNNFMDLLILGGAPTGVSTVLAGLPSFAAVDSGYNNLFHAAGANCAGQSGFKDLMNCSPVPMLISFQASQDTNVLLSDFTDNGDGTYKVSTNHDGSIIFNVPEPTSIALLGLGLLGFGAARRRKA